MFGQSIDVVLAELKVHHDERAEGQYTGSHRSGT